MVTIIDPQISINEWNMKIQTEIVYTCKYMHVILIVYIQKKIEK